MHGLAVSSAARSCIDARAPKLRREPSIRAPRSGPVEGGPIHRWRRFVAWESWQSASERLLPSRRIPRRASSTASPSVWPASAPTPRRRSGCVSTRSTTEICPSTRASPSTRRSPSHVSASSDSRPESRRPDTTTIDVQRKITTGSDRRWRERRQLVEPLISDSMCAILAEEKRSGRSLGAFRPGPRRRRSGDQGRRLDRAPSRRAQSDDALRPRQRRPRAHPVALSVPLLVRWIVSRAPSRASSIGRSTRPIEAGAGTTERRKRSNGSGGSGSMSSAGRAKTRSSSSATSCVHREAFSILGVFWPPKSEDGENLQLRF